MQAVIERHVTAGPDLQYKLEQSGNWRSLRNPDDSLPELRILYAGRLRSSEHYLICVKCRKCKFDETIDTALFRTMQHRRLELYQRGSAQITLVSDYGEDIYLHRPQVILCLCRMCPSGSGPAEGKPACSADPSRSIRRSAWPSLPSLKAKGVPSRPRLLRPSRRSGCEAQHIRRLITLLPSEDGGVRRISAQI